mmetsp:Transcript_51054/g.150526  ORF Transcript_51054/g.150526 Transcript_51054/m.150526 type:complete len:449 (+) Transcript_51054:70-1416(+)
MCSRRRTGAVAAARRHVVRGPRGERVEGRGRPVGLVLPERPRDILLEQLLDRAGAVDSDRHVRAVVGASAVESRRDGSVVGSLVLGVPAPDLRPLDELRGRGLLELLLLGDGDLQGPVLAEGGRLRRQGARPAHGALGVALPELPPAGPRRAVLVLAIVLAPSRVRGAGLRVRVGCLVLLLAPLLHPLLGDEAEPVGRSRRAEGRDRGVRLSVIGAARGLVLARGVATRASRGRERRVHPSESRPRVRRRGAPRRGLRLRRDREGRSPRRGHLLLLALLPHLLQELSEAHDLVRRGVETLDHLTASLNFRLGWPSLAHETRTWRRAGRHGPADLAWLARARRAVVVADVEAGGARACGGASRLRAAASRAEREEFKVRREPAQVAQDLGASHTLGRLRLRLGPGGERGRRRRGGAAVQDHLQGPAIRLIHHLSAARRIDVLQVGGSQR